MMGLNSMGRGRGQRGSESFNREIRHGGGMGDQGIIFRPGPPNMFCAPVMRCSPPVPHKGPSFFGPRPGYTLASSKPRYPRFPRKNFQRKFPLRHNETLTFDIDLTRPWVTEALKNDEIKMQEFLTTWKVTRADEDWNKYKAQKTSVQSLYENARAQYIASHPNEAAYWNGMSHFKKLYCETCDKSFKTDDDLIIHESEHETCGRDGCEFTAHPKIISKHIKMQHDSGLYGRIGKLYTEEDISKWIEERKRRYPTRKLVEEKKAMEEEKMNRGERIKEDSSRFNKSFGNRNRSEMKKKFERKIKSRNRRQKKKKKNLPPPTTDEENLPTSIRKGVPAFQGIKDSTESEPTETIKDKEDEADNLNISDDEWETENKLEIVKPVLNSSLGLLASVYESDEENHSTEIQQGKIDKHVSEDEGSGPEEVVTVHRKSPLMENVKEKIVSRKRKFLDKNNRNQKRIKNIGNEKNSETRSLTLLEKLLKDEIRHERNVILQCVHYVVKHNFFKT